MIDIFVKYIAGPLIGMMSSYFHLNEYGKVLYKQARGNFLKYNSEKQFWKDSIGEYFYQTSQRKLFPDKLVKLIDFEITEWFPRCPGLYWTEEGEKYREMAKGDLLRLYRGKNKIYERRDLLKLYDYTVLTPRGKSRMILGGMGTTRLKEHKIGEQKYKVLCATSSGKCDAGIPIVVSAEAYKKIRNEINAEGSVKADIEGFYSQIPIKWEDTVIETPRSEISKRVKEWIATSYYVPRYYLQVGSPLQIKKRESETKVRATAWTLYGCNEDNPLPYSFTFHPFDPKDPNSIKEATDFIKEYVHDFGGRGILTEFDEVISRFPSIYPISNVMLSKVDWSKEQKRIMERAKGLEVRKTPHHGNRRRYLKI